MRVVRIIGRLNIGGPAIQAVTLTRRLEEHGYQTLLARGREGPDEGNMDHLADALGVCPVRVPGLQRDPGWHDLRALVALVRIIRRERPQIVHTHAAKAGTLGRLATVIAFPRKRHRPILIHTFHGHSLSGYFSPRTAAVYRRIEHALARVTDRLIAVSDEVRDELVALGVCSPSKFEVVRLGFDLSPFTVNGTARSRIRETVRAELGLPANAWVVTLTARLVPIKRVDRFLAAARAMADLSDVWFLIVGDGELRDSLKGSPDARSLGDRLVWTGFRTDIPAICFASDVIVLTSDNEGTPVSLIEGQAAGLPVVTTDVGGARSVVEHGKTGFVVPRHEPEALQSALRTICADHQLAADLGRAGRLQSVARFGLDRLVDDIVRLYEATTLDRVPTCVG